MNWKQLTDIAQLDEIRQKSLTIPQVIFKHSTRCSISSMALSRLERAEPSQQADFYFLDLLANRSLSHEVAKVFDVPHESPQVLVIKDGNCIYDESHMGISMDEIDSQISSAA